MPPRPRNPAAIKSPRSSQYQDLLVWWPDYGKAYRREQIDRFKRDIKRGKVVELHNTTHGGFVFEKEQQEILIREMRAFLLNEQ